MDWFLYDIGLLHERVKGITLCDYDFIFLRSFCDYYNIYFCKFDEKLRKFVLQKGLTSYVVSKIIIASISKIYRFDTF